MRVALINSLYAPYIVGGAEQSVQLLAEGLHKKGVEVIVVSLHNGDTTVMENLNGVRVYRVPLWNIYWPFSYGARKPPEPVRILWHVLDMHNGVMARRVRHIIADERPDIVHTNNLAGFSPAVWIVAKRMGIPIIHTLRDYTLMCPRGMYKNGVNCAKVCVSCQLYAMWPRQCSRYVDSVVGVSNFVLERFIGNGFFSRSSRRVIYNAVPMTVDLYGGVRTSLMRIGFLGRLSPEKGLQDLIKAIRSSRLLRENVELVVGGRGPGEFEAKLRAMANGIRVRWKGFVSPRDVFSEVDVVVVPSRWHEPFGRVVIEAYSFGKPVVAARRGGIVEIVDDGCTGWLYDPDDVESLQKVLENVYRNREVLSYMGLGAKLKARHFDVDSYVEAYLEAYGGVVGKARQMQRWK